MPRPKGAAALPPFYFPDGPPLSPRKRAAADSKITAAFAGKPLNAAAFVKVTKQIVELPSFLSGMLFSKLDPTGTGAVTQEAFTAFWRAKLERADPSTRVFEVLRTGQANHLTHADLKPMMRVILDTHPGLEFLKEAPEFQERYAETVVYRIFYTVNRKGDRRLSLRELKRSDLVEAMLQVDAEEDINKILRYFSYEHFYVIYCKFWELDTVWTRRARGVQGLQIRRLLREAWVSGRTSALLGCRAFAWRFTGFHSATAPLTFYCGVSRPCVCCGVCVCCNVVGV